MSDSFATPWTAAQQSSLSYSICQSLLIFLCIEMVMLSNHFILCRSLLLSPSVFPSIRVFSNELAFCIRCPKYWNFSFSISPSNEYSGLIFFRINWFDLAAQETPRSLCQHHSSKVWIDWCSAFLMVQLLYLHVTISLTIHTLVGRVMSLLFNMLSRLVIAFLPRSKHLLISRLQSPSAVILEPKKIKFVTVSAFFLFYLPRSDGTDAIILVFECWVLSQPFHFPLSYSSRGTKVPLYFLPFLHGSQLCCGEEAWVTQWNYESCLAVQPKTDGS